MIYAVIPDYIPPPQDDLNHEDDEERFYDTIKQRIGDLGESYNTDFYPPIAYVVFRGSAKELSEKLGFDKQKQDPGVVIAVQLINGWISKSLWEWIRANSSENKE